MTMPAGNSGTTLDFESEIIEPRELEKLMNILKIISLQHSQNGRYCSQLAAIQEDW